jgi:hypothetical protein
MLTSHEVFAQFSGLQEVIQALIVRVSVLAFLMSDDVVSEFNSSSVNKRKRIACDLSPQLVPTLPPVDSENVLHGTSADSLLCDFMFDEHIFDFPTSNLTSSRSMSVVCLRSSSSSSSQSTGTSRASMRGTMMMPEAITSGESDNVDDEEDDRVLSECSFLEEEEGGGGEEEGLDFDALTDRDLLF